MLKCEKGRYICGNSQWLLLKCFNKNDQGLQKFLLKFYVFESFKVTWFNKTCFQTAYRNYWTLDARVGRWTLVAGVWMLNPGRWPLDVGSWTLDSGRWTLNPGRWTLDAECQIMDVQIVHG